MPGLNPFYWLTCRFIVVASLVLAALVGFGAFRGTRFFVRHSRNAYLIAKARPTITFTILSVIRIPAM